MAAKKPPQKFASALPITDSETNAAIVRGLIAGLPPEFAGAVKHLREIERRCEVIGRLGKSERCENAVHWIGECIQWLEMFDAGFIQKPDEKKGADVSLF